jgi:hypothetical protein
VIDVTQLPVAWRKSTFEPSLQYAQIGLVLRQRSRLFETPQSLVELELRRNVWQRLYGELAGPLEDVIEFLELRVACDEDHQAHAAVERLKAAWAKAKKP